MQFSVSIDFNDDMWKAETDWSADKLRESIKLLAGRGITNIRWVDHGSFNDGLYDPGSGFDKQGCASRLRESMPDPRQVVIDQAHALGLTVTMVLKPWDLAFGSPSLLFPGTQGPQPPVGLAEIGGHGGACHYWLREYPQSVVRLHPSLLEPDRPRQAIGTIRLWHEQSVLSAAPAIELYTSQDNVSYELYSGPVQLTQTVRSRRPPQYRPAPETACGAEGDFACIELSALQIDAPYVCIVPAAEWPLENTLTALLEIEDIAGAPVVVTLGLAPLQPNGQAVDWKNGGIAYDCARQTMLRRGVLSSCSALRMAVNFVEQPWIAIARGRNEYRGGHVEFADDQVRSWLTSLVTDALAAGVDAVDIRFGSHTECLDLENYGFHPAIVSAYRQRYGVDITTEPFDRAAWRELRGEYVDLWLREVAQAVRSQGAKMLIHLSEAMAAPSTRPCLYEIAWHWQEWLRTGLVDEVTFKMFNLDGEFFHQAVQLCQEHDLPMIWGRKPGGATRQIGWLEAMDKAEAAGFEHFDLYELAGLQKLCGNGMLKLELPWVWQRIAATQP